MTEKYLGSKNENYPRKNWSSVVLWNCEHPANRALTPEFVQSATGAQLHRFTWLDDALIGELPKSGTGCPMNSAPTPRPSSFTSRWAPLLPRIRHDAHGR